MLSHALIARVLLGPPWAPQAARTGPARVRKQQVNTIAGHYRLECRRLNSVADAGRVPRILGRAFCCCPCAQTSHQNTAGKGVAVSISQNSQRLHAAAWVCRIMRARRVSRYHAHRVQHCEEHRDDDDGWRKCQEYRPAQLRQLPYTRDQTLQTDPIISGQPPVHKAESVAGVHAHAPQGPRY